MIEVGDAWEGITRGSKRVYIFYCRKIRFKGVEPYSCEMMKIRRAKDAGRTYYDYRNTMTSPMEEIKAVDQANEYISKRLKEGWKLT